jgi:hypothetical protein
LVRKLQRTHIIRLDCFNSYSFQYPYLYYYFAAKYIADHVDETQETTRNIIENLHLDENAYIAVFISHHSKSAFILDEITIDALALFESFDPAGLSKSELEFFDRNLDNIVQEVLPGAGSSPERERERRLHTEDEVESEAENRIGERDIEEEFHKELRRSVKTVEVMGRIIKNRAGSLDKARLESIFEEAMFVHLRLLSSFLDVVEKGEKEIVDYISKRVSKLIQDEELKRKEAGKKIYQKSEAEIEKLSKVFFWNTNFFLTIGVLNKIVHSLGSDKLNDIVGAVCDRIGTPASFIVKHGILMWYSKNLRVEEIVARIDDNGFSETAKKALRFLIADHCSMHSVDFRKQQIIQNRFSIPPQKLLKTQK